MDASVSSSSSKHSSSYSLVSFLLKLTRLSRTLKTICNRFLMWLLISLSFNRILVFFSANIFRFATKSLKRDCETLSHKIWICQVIGGNGHWVHASRTTLIWSLQQIMVEVMRPFENVSKIGHRKHLTKSRYCERKKFSCYIVESVLYSRFHRYLSELILLRSLPYFYRRSSSSTIGRLSIEFPRNCFESHPDFQENYEISSERQDNPSKWTSKNRNKNKLLL